MTNEQIAWSSQLAYDADVCLSIEYHLDSPVETIVVRSHY